MEKSVIDLAESIIPKIAIYVKNYSAISPYDLDDYTQDLYILAAESMELAGRKGNVSAESILWKKFIHHTQQSYRSELLLSNPDDIELFADNEGTEEKIERLKTESLFVNGMTLATQDMNESSRKVWLNICGLGENGKMSLYEIAAEEGVSLSTIRKRLERTQNDVLVDMREFVSEGHITRKRKPRLARKQSVDLDAFAAAA